MSGRVPLRVALLVVGVAAVVGIGSGVALELATRSAAQPARPAPALRGQILWPEGKQAAPELGLRDQTGRRLSIDSLRGRPLVVAFLDSRCTQVCPLEGRALAWAIRQLPAASRPTLVAVSVDPWADTPRSARIAARHWGFRGRWHWLLGTPRQLAPVWAAYHVAVQRTAGDIVHTDAVYLVDRRGFERAGYLYPFPPAFVAHDLRLLDSEHS